MPTQTSEATGLGLEQGKNISTEKAVLLLVEFFKAHGKFLNRTDCFIRGLWNKTSAVRACESMCELLNRGNASKPGTSALPDFDRLVIIHFLISVCKYLSENTKQKSKLIHVSSVILVKLPNLLTFYRKEADLLPDLIRIPYYLDLAALAATDLKDPFLLVLEELKDIFLQSTDNKTIISCGSTLGKFVTSSFPLEKYCKTELVKIVDEITSNHTSENIKKIDSLCRVVDLTSELTIDWFTTCNKFISQATDSVVNLVFYWHM